MPPKRAKKKKSNYTKIGKADKTTNLNPEDQKEAMNAFFYKLDPPKFLNSFLAILKKNFIVRRRTSSTFVTMFLMPFFILPITQFDIGEKAGYSDVRHPVTQEYPFITYNITNELEKRESHVFGIAPNTINVKKIFKDFPHKIHFYNSTETLVNAMYNVNIGVGYYIRNPDDSNFCVNPKIAIPTKDFNEYAEDSLIIELHQQITKYCNSSHRVTFKHKQYAGKVAKYRFTADNVIVTYMMLPIVSLLGNEAGFLMKDRAYNFISLILLSGCNPILFWTATVVTAILCALPSCLIMSYYLTSESILIDSDMSVVFIYFFLFSISTTFSTFLLSLAINKENGEKSVKLPMTVLSMLFSFISGFMRNFNSKSLVFMISIVFPQIPYTQGLTSIFATYRFSGPVTWNNFYSSENFSMSNSFYMLLMSNIFYMVVFFSTILWQETRFNIKRLKAWFIRHPRDYYAGEGIVLKARGLRKSYRDTKALNGVDFELENGDVVAIIGPNGSGKSTLIGTMTNTIIADDGHISLFGHEETDQYKGFEEIKQCSGVCFQMNTLIPELSIREHLSLFGAIRGLSKEQLLDRCDILLSSLQLAPVADTQSVNLSGGQKRKLCIAIAMLAKPPFIILDEPTAGVDFEARQNIWKVLAAQKESVIMITSHALEESESVCNKIFVMSKGEIKKRGSATELRSQFKCGYILRVVNENYDKEGFLQMLRTVIENVTVEKRKKNTYHIPIVEDKIALFVKTLETRMKEFGVDQFTFTIEALEEVLLKIVNEEDQLINVPPKH